MKIEKTERSYQVTEYDLKFGEQITLNDELLVPISIIDKIKAKIETLDFDWGDDLNPTARSISMVCDAIDECIKDCL